MASITPYLRRVIPVFSRKPLFGYAVMVYSGIAIGFLAFGVWAHHMFAVGLGPIADAIFASTTMLIAVPTGVKIFNWIATMHRGAVSFKTPMLYSVGFISMFIIGGLSGIMHASPPAAHADPVPVEHPHNSNGQDNRKLLMWAFLASDACSSACCPPPAWCTRTAVWTGPCHVARSGRKHSSGPVTSVE